MLHLSNVYRSLIRLMIRVSCLRQIKKTLEHEEPSPAMRLNFAVKVPWTNLLDAFLLFDDWKDQMD
jgi:hypothetical protein